jgi:hypothetical protein
MQLRHLSKTSSSTSRQIEAAPAFLIGPAEGLKMLSIPGRVTTMSAMRTAARNDRNANPYGEIPAGGPG